MHLSGVWYALALSLTCKEKVLLKWPVSVNTLLYSLCIFCVVCALVTLPAHVDLQESSPFHV